jgi:hypothetical protein
LETPQPLTAIDAKRKFVLGAVEAARSLPVCDACGQAPKRLHVLFDDDEFLATLCDECAWNGYDTPPLNRRTPSSAPLLPEYPDKAGDTSG